MSGIEVMGVILALYPAVIDLCKAYRGTRGNASKSLERKVVLASTMYEQTLRGILLSGGISAGEMQPLFAVGNVATNQALWVSLGIDDKLRHCYGAQRLSDILGYLSDMEDALGRVRAELTRMCRDNNDSFKARIKLAIASRPQSEMIQRLQEVITLNKQLRELLDGWAPLLLVSPRRVAHDDDNIIHSPHPGGPDRDHEVGKFIAAIQSAYTCVCATAHIIGLGCYCTLCTKPLTLLDRADDSTGWEFGLAAPFTGQDDAHIRTAALLMPASHGNAYHAPTIGDLCSLLTDDMTASGAYHVLKDDGGVSDTENQAYMLKLTKAGSGGSELASIKHFSELLQPGSLSSTRDRLELAIQLSLAILRLCRTPWIGSSWTWNNTCVGLAQAAAEDSSPIYRRKFSIFILRDFYSATGTVGDSAAPTLATVTPSLALSHAPGLLDDEAILYQLGLALIELALGKTIDELKAGYGLDSLHDKEWSNFYTASRLIRERKISMRATIKYERVVNACVHHKYVDRDGNLKSLLSEPEYFMSNVRNVIIVPLVELWKSYL
ncbi:hypothetical protein B0T19DRAFT_437040 [Cercophora scortea]|uniref:DUF7580 domain-containing protein n=1 Tax=Cercophora scortea TaxID=314031 RepID=A0AAE0MKX0_9PEZI|nr:hypothetical protein B0T19DRAFT_437040 [Cercophora scortea]